MDKMAAVFDPGVQYNVSYCIDTPGVICQRTILPSVCHSVDDAAEKQRRRAGELATMVTPVSGIFVTPVLTENRAASCIIV